MTSAANAYDGSPSMRGVRDKYLALLLSGGREAPREPPPPPAWTPGRQLPKYSEAQWASPVTPAPTENDVRLAEIAAGLVAAGGVEKRQADTIRRLATQLERSEKKLRVLQTGEKRRPRPTSSPSAGNYYEDDPPSTRHQTRRSIHFTPRTAKRDSRYSRLDDSHKRPSSSRAAREGKRDPYKELEELEDLRRERAEWLKGKERSEREAESLTNLLADIKDNTQKLLKERNDHLKVIARLQTELSSVKLHASRESADRERFEEPRTIEFSPRPIQPETPHSPQPVFSRQQSFDFHPQPVNEHYREVSPAASPASSHHPVYHTDPEHAAQNGTPPHQSSQHTPLEVREIEMDLRKELQLVLAENAGLAERIPFLQAQCEELSQKLEEAEKKQIEKESADCQAMQSSIVQGAGIEACLTPLIAEVDILEGVASAINFSVSPTEAERLQETLTLVDGALLPSQVDSKDDEPQNPAPMSQSELISELVERLVHVRSKLSLRYGQWLEAVAHDGLSNNTENLAEASTDLGDSEELIDTVSIDTGVIDNLLKSEG